MDPILVAVIFCHNWTVVSALEIMQHKHTTTTIHTCHLLSSRVFLLNNASSDLQSKGSL